MHFDIFVLQIKNVEKFLSAHIFCQSVLVIREIIKKVFTIFLFGEDTLCNDGYFEQRDVLS